MDDTRPRATATVDVDLTTLAVELGDDRLSLAEDGRTVVYTGDGVVTQGSLAAAVAAHDPQPSPVEQARQVRDQRSAAVATPTAQLLDAVAFYLAEERGQAQPDARWVTVLEALRQLGLKGVADEAVQHGSGEYAAIYTERIGQP